MAFFDKVRDSLETAKQEVSNKAKSTTESIRIGNLVKTNEKMIEKLMYQVGLRCFEEHGQETGTVYDTLFQEIRRLKAENEIYQGELYALTMTACPRCGSANNVQTNFCIGCGFPLKEGEIQTAQGAGGRVCGRCGAQNEADTLFCTECGTKIETV